MEKSIESPSEQQRSQSFNRRKLTALKAKIVKAGISQINGAQLEIIDILPKCKVPQDGPSLPKGVYISRGHKIVLALLLGQITTCGWH